VFEAFLEAMGGKHPMTIITDQDKAMKAAIQLVFRNTRHRNCLFHIKTKCYNKNGKVFATNKGLYEDFENIVNNCLTVEEFERMWVKMIEDKKLQNNKYLTKMWEMRHRFIPVYYKNDFFPFIQTTSRSESLNSRMKDNVGPTYNIMSFLKEYDRVIETINTAEKLEDTYSNQKRPKEFIFGYTIEQQAIELYNINIFRKFQI
jgi:transposase-like protein